MFVIAIMSVQDIQKKEGLLTLLFSFYFNFQPTLTPSGSSFKTAAIYPQLQLNEFSKSVKFVKTVKFNQFDTR